MICMYLAHLNQHHQSHFFVSRVARCSELVSSDCGDRCCVSTCQKLFVGLNSGFKNSLKQSIQVELNTYSNGSPSEISDTHEYEEEL